jgi:hypothetical protein
MDYRGTDEVLGAEAAHERVVVRRLARRKLAHHRQAEAVGGPLNQTIGLAARLRTRAVEAAAALARATGLGRKEGKCDGRSEWCRYTHAKHTFDCWCRYTHAKHTFDCWTTPWDV